MISSLDGNDVLSMSRKYQQKYQDELLVKGYIEVTPPLLLNIAGVTVETGTSSFKEFMILFDKIYQGSNSIVAKRKLDPNNKISTDAQKAKVQEYFNKVTFDQIISTTMSEPRTINPLKKLLKENGTAITIEEDYFLRKGMFNVVSFKLNEWIEKLEQEVFDPSTKRIEHLQTIRDIQKDWLLRVDEITRFENKDSPQLKTVIYDTYMKLNTYINDALTRIEANFVPWSKLVRSNEVKYNSAETESQINRILDEMRLNKDTSIEITSAVYNNMVKLGDRIKTLPSSESETVSGIDNEIISDPRFLRYNKAVYDPPPVPNLNLNSPPLPPPPERYRYLTEEGAEEFKAEED